MMPQSVSIEGDGIAACCCARLLQDSIPYLSVEQSGKSTPLSILISQSTQRLLSDVFEDVDVLADFPIISKRVVLWGRESSPVTVPHFGVAVSESVLLQRLWAKTRRANSQSKIHADWRLISRADQAPSEQQRFGTRVASAAEVQLARSADRESCWVESLPGGWLFLLPSGCGKGSLISVGDKPEVLLEQSRLVAQQLESLGGPAAKFPAYPRVASPLCAAGWLVVRTAAMAFDPVCGEGAGNAVREAILASAVLRAISKGAECGPVLHHYSSRLFAGFLRHLETCEQFYLTARDGAWWDAELALLQAGISWTYTQLSKLPPVRHRLVDFDLEEVSSSSR